MVACVRSYTTTTRLATTPELSVIVNPDPNMTYMVSSVAKFVDTVRNELMLAVQNNDEAQGVAACNKLESYNFTKEDLETTRIGGFVNGVRKQLTTSCPGLSHKCRDLIKQWRHQTDTSTRTASSVNNGKSLKRTNDEAFSSDATAIKRRKLAVISNNMNRSQVSLSGVRRDVGSTAELLAQLSENLTPDVSSASKSNSASPGVISTQARLTIAPASVNERQKRKYTKRAAKFFKNDVSSNVPMPPIVEKQPKKNDSEKKLEKEKKKEEVATTVDVASLSSTFCKANEPIINWYSMMPTIKSLDAQTKILPKTSNIRDTCVDLNGARQMMCMPVVDVGFSDLTEFKYSSEKPLQLNDVYSRSFRNILPKPN